MTKIKKILMPAVIGTIAVSVVMLSAPVSFAAAKKAQPLNTQPLKVVGMAKFVLRGTVVSVAADSVTLHITNTSKNARLFDNKDKVISIGSKTTITRNGKNISLKQIKSGDRVKVFGIFDKKSGTIKVVRWIKVVK